MKIKWNGHSSFTITSDKGTVIVTDPYNPDSYGEDLTYEPVRDRADCALVSHGHPDHSYVKSLSGSPVVLKGSGEIKGISVTAIKTFHDDSGGSKRGDNTAFRFTLDGITVCFLGDLGHILSKAQMDALGSVDILLVPVGGTYTLDPVMASQLIYLVKPKVAIPMHFRTKKCAFPIKGVEEFLSHIKDVKRLGRSEVVLSSGMLPGEGTQVWVLDYAC